MTYEHWLLPIYCCQLLLSTEDVNNINHEVLGQVRRSVLCTKLGRSHCQSHISSNIKTPNGISIDQSAMSVEGLQNEAVHIFSGSSTLQDRLGNASVWCI